jgi:hypothetical protein
MDELKSLLTTAVPDFKLLPEESRGKRLGNARMGYAELCESSRVRYG